MTASLKATRLAEMTSFPRKRESISVRESRNLRSQAAPRHPRPASGPAFSAAFVAAPARTASSSSTNRPHPDRPTRIAPTRTAPPGSPHPDRPHPDRPWHPSRACTPRSAGRQRLEGRPASSIRIADANRLYSRSGTVLSPRFDRHRFPLRKPRVRSCTRRRRRGGVEMKVTPSTARRLARSALPCIGPRLPSPPAPLR